MSIADGDTKESSTAMFDGDTNKDWIAFDKSVGRWARGKYGTTIGDALWRNEMPDIASLRYAEQMTHFQDVWDAIDNVNSSKAKHLYNSPVFWTGPWHLKWRTACWDRLYDYVDSKTTGQANMEVVDVGMSHAPALRKHLTRNFGGSGEDVRAREARYQEGMRRTADEKPFFKGVNVPHKLRELAAERTALWKMCAEDKRGMYEWGKEKSLVKIVMKHTRSTEYEPCVEALLQEIKIQKQVAKSVPKMNAAGTGLVMPDPAEMAVSTDDWEFRNYSDAWLPSWDQLRTKLVATYKSKQFRKAEKGNDHGSSGGNGDNGGNGGGSRKLPVLLMKEIKDAVRDTIACIVPGLGSSPVPMRDARGPMECWNCGKSGHKSFECTEPKKGGSFGGDKGGKRKWPAKKNGVDGVSAQKSDEVCRAFRDTGKCRWGAKCKFVHVKNPGGKRPAKFAGILSKKQKKEITAAAVRTLKDATSDGKTYDDTELSGFLKDLW
jgi:hypothetical protein